MKLRVFLTHNRLRSGVWCVLKVSTASSIKIQVLIHPPRMFKSLIEMPTLSALSLLFLFSNVVSSTHPKHLRVTAVISDDNDTRARFECWEMATPFSTYPTVGDAITGLADVTNISYVILPARSEEGLHKPPHPMLVQQALIPVLHSRIVDE